MTWNWKEDLHAHPNGTKGSVQAKLTLDNITLSIVGGPNLYGNGNTSFEVGVMIGETPWKIASWRSEGEVDAIVQIALGTNELLNELLTDFT